MHNKTAHEIRDMLRRREVSAVDITRNSFERINLIDDKLGAFLSLQEDEALKAAEVIDARLKNGEELPPLAGIPAGIKDNICVRGAKNTCASKMLENFIAPYDAAVVEKLKENGAIFIGKLNMDEFAMGSSNENSAYKKVRNPYDLERVPGGSSGGGAAAVAAGEVFYSLGSDTGGSVRLPASLCGIVGMKPTYGRVSRYGLVAFASSMDQIGPLTRDVEDCAMVMNAIAGKDLRDSTSVNVKAEDYTQYLKKDLRGLKIGLPEEYFGEGIDKDVRKTVLNSVKVLEEQGAVFKNIRLPMSKYALEVYYIIACSEASSNLARFDGIRYGYRADKYEDAIDIYIKSRSQSFGSEVKRRIMLGTFALSSGYYDEYYKKALKVKKLIIEEFGRAFREVDVILSPTSPTTAFKFEEKSSNPVAMYHSDICTAPVNIAGITALSLPAGFVNGLPVGLQFIGNYFEEVKILQAAYAFEQETGYYKTRPSI